MSESVDPSAALSVAPRWSRLRRRLTWTAAGLALLAGLWSLLVGAWLPVFLKPRIEAAASDALGLPLDIDDITLRPWALEARIAGLSLGDPQAEGGPLLRVGAVQVRVALLASLGARAPVLSRLHLEAPVLNLRRLPGAEERFNFSPMLDRLRERAAARPAEPPSAEPARFALHNLSLAAGELHYVDPVRGLAHHVEALRIGLPLLSSLPADVAIEIQPLLEARVDGSEFRLDGQARPFAPQRPAELALHWRRLDLAPYASVLRALLPPELAPQRLQGQLDAELRLSFEARPAPAAPLLRLQGRLGLSEFGLAVPGQGLDLAWQQLELAGLDLAPLERRHHLERVSFERLAVALDRAAPKGSPSVAPKAAGAAAASAASAASAPAGAEASAPLPPLQWALDAFECRDCSVQLRDHSQATPLALRLEQIGLRLGGLASPQPGVAPTPWTFALDAALRGASGAAVDAAPRRAAAADEGEAGRLHLAGQLSGLLAAPGAPAPFALQAELGLGAIDLRLLQPYIEPHLNLRLVDARFGTAGQLALERAAGADWGALRASYRGRAGLERLRTQDSVTGADFLGWQRLALDGLAVSWAGGALDADFGRIGLDGLRARIILNADGRLNLADLVRRDKQAAPRSLTTATPADAAADTPRPAAAPPERSGPAPKLRWQGITLRDGGIDFSDLFIKPNYNARLTRLQGELGALSSAAPEPARLSLAGALDDGAPLRIAGRVHPLGARLYTDLEASARGIALTRMSTYAERYAGYAIEKGALSVTLRYKIEQGKLEAENQVFLDQLTFGEAVDSPDALKLPVRLAVALLKNSRGEIDLRLPVAGTLDDPQFSVGGVVWQVFVNLLTRVVTAPFSWLMDGAGNEASQLPFAPGSAELDDAARERLDQLAGKLLDKPTLKLEVTGQVDPVLDAEAIQAAHRAARVAAAQKAAAPGQSASAAAGSRAAVPAAPAASAPAPVVAPLAADELARALRSLADARADRALVALTARLPAERVLLNRSQIGAAPGDAAPGARVQFELR